MLRYLKIPLWIFQVATAVKSFRGNPIIGSRRLNRLGLHAGRVTLANRLAARRRNGLLRAIDAETAREFDRNGYVRIENFLETSDFLALQKAVLNHRGRARDMVQGDTVTRRMAVDRPLLDSIPELAALVEDPRWRSSINYAGSFEFVPATYVQSIFAHVHDAPADPQTMLHADTFHPTVKAWFFLTDVSADDGPLCYVPGSHRLTPARLAWDRARSLRAPDGLDRLSARGSLRIDQAELAELDLPQPIAFTVPANTLVVCDTFGFHARGRATHPATRVEIWAYGRRSPFLPWAGLNPLNLPGLAHRQERWTWAVRDRFPKLFGQPWHAVGERTPLERPG